MWSKILKPVSGPTLPARPTPVARPVATPVRPTRVLQSSRTPQQLSFEFRRG